MCEYLAKMTEEEGLELKQQVSKLAAWKNWMTGGLAAFGVVSTIATLLVLRGLTKMDNMSTTINTLNMNLAVFQSDVKPHLTTTARISPSDLIDSLKLNNAEMREWVNARIESHTPSAATKEKLSSMVQAISRGEDAHNHHTTRIESIERRIETLERAAHTDE